MRLRTLVANILLPAVVAITVLAGWVWVTGSTDIPVPTVIGLALAAAGVAAGVEWLFTHAQHVWRRRTRPARHRKAV